MHRGTSQSHIYAAGASALSMLVLAARLQALPEHHLPSQPRAAGVTACAPLVAPRCSSCSTHKDFRCGLQPVGPLPSISWAYVPRADSSPQCTASLQWCNCIACTGYIRGKKRSGNSTHATQLSASNLLPRQDCQAQCNPCSCPRGRAAVHRL